MKVQWIGVRALMAMMVAIGLLAALTAGAALTRTNAQGPPLLLFASDRAPDYQPEVYSLDLAGGARVDMSRAVGSDRVIAVRGNQVVFASDRRGEALYSARIGSSSAPHRFAGLPSGLGVLSGAWSSGGAELAVVLNTSHGNVRIELVDASGRKLALLDHAGSAGPSLWSADGQRLAYNLQIPGLPRIKVADARGQVLFTRRADQALWAQAAPRLALVTQHFKKGQLDSGSTAVIDEQGRAIRNFDGVALAFSPDGETLVLARAPRALWLASVDTGELRRLPPGGAFASAAISPDGQHLELRTDTSTGETTQIVSVPSGRIEAHLPGFGQWFPDSRRLAIAGPWPQNVVSIVNTNGRVVRRIQIGPAGEFASTLAVSQDSAALVYTAQSYHIHQLYAQLPSGELHQMTNRHQGTPGFADHTEPAPSPDGALIADMEFEAPCGNCVPQQIAVLPADGSSPARVVSGASAVDSHPTWSPDGTRVAYASGDPTGSGITVVHADGSQATALASGADATEPSWAPDGSTIAAVHDGIFLMASDGSSPAKLTGAVPAGSDAGQTHAPAWSPDSLSLAFAGADGLYLIGRDGSGLRQILAMPGISSVAWSPDGALIAFAACQSETAGCTNSFMNDIWTVRPDGSQLRRITHNIADDTTPTWLPQP